MPEPEASNAPLLIDAMLGSLAHHLRWLGYDAEYRSHLSDEEMMRIAQREGRVLITRDRALAQRRGQKTLYLAATELEEQVQAVVQALGPAAGPGRCTICNGQLDPLPAAEAAALVPPYVAQTQTDFVRCARCGRVYWAGTHAPGLRAWQQIANQSEAAPSAVGDPEVTAPPPQ